MKPIKHTVTGKSFREFTGSAALRSRVVSMLGQVLPSVMHTACNAIRQVSSSLPVFPQKVKSELISANVAGIIEAKFAKLSEDIRCKVARGDNDPDMVFSDGVSEYVLEIKVANGHRWRGGEYSQRETDHLFIGWSDTVDGSPAVTVSGKPAVKVYACIIPIVNSDWQPAIPGQYYAPVIDKRRLIRDDRIDVVGKIVSWHKTKQTVQVKIDEAVIVLR